MAEQTLIENKYPVRVMPLPSGIREGCGFCLRFFPEQLEGAVEFLSERGFTIAEAFIQEETGATVSYKKISLTNGGRLAKGQ